MSPADPESGPEILTRKTLVYRFLRGTSAVAAYMYFGCRIEGRENLPAEGGFLLASNHQSYMDIPLLSVACRRHVSFVARDSLARSVAMRFILHQTGSVLVQRDASDRRALREMAAHLEQDDAVAVFPEGTRSHDGRLGAFKRGALLAARSARVPVVPVGIRGTFEAWPRGRWPRPRRIQLSFGRPLDPTGPRALEELRAAIGALIDEPAQEDSEQHDPEQQAPEGGDRTGTRSKKQPAEGGA